MPQHRTAKICSRKTYRKKRHSAYKEAISNVYFDLIFHLHQCQCRPFIPRIVHYSQFATQLKGTHARHQTSGKRINFNFDVMLTSFLFPCSNLPLKARARLEMREKASQQDAKDVVEIMKYSLLDTFSDDFGNLDFQRSQHGSGMSSRAQVSLRGEGSVLIVTYPAKSVFNN